MIESAPRARRVTAVVVTYQSARTLPACIDALRRGYDAGLLEAVFVDNASVDDTIRLLEERARPWAEIVLTGVNNGFGRGNNIGLARVTTPYTVFVNPDAIVEPAAIVALTTFMDHHPDVGITGPAISEGEDDGDRVLQETGPRATPWTMLRRQLPLLRRAPTTCPIRPGTEPFRTGWVCGAVFMVRTELMRRLGGFDPRYFMYWEEIDVCKRADDLGSQTWAVGTAEARHVGGASSGVDDTRISGCIARHYYQSRRYYMVKHHGWFAATACELAEFLALCVAALGDLVRGRGAARLKPRLQAKLLSRPGRV
jgi:GT2 family glycosyltransferase